MKNRQKEEKPEIQYHEFDYSGDGESEKLAEEFLPDEPEEAGGHILQRQNGCI